MKKILTLLAFVGLFSLQGCTVKEDQVIPPDNDTISEVIEVGNVSFTSSNNYARRVVINPPIFDSDMILVYRLSAVSQGNDVWKLLPETYFFPDGTRDFGFDFDFTKNDVDIFLVGNNLATVPDAFRLNQVLRIVILPASFSKSINTANYNAVISALNINENQIKKIDL